MYGIGNGGPRNIGGSIDVVPRPPSPPAPGAGDVTAARSAIALWAAFDSRRAAVAGDLDVYLERTPTKSRLTLEVPAGSNSLPPAVAQLTSVRWLSLNLTTSSTSDELPTQLGAMHDVKHLAIRGANMSTHDWAVLRDMPQLETLDLQGCDLQSGFPAWFDSDNFPRLTTLKIDAPADSSVQLNFGALDSMTRLVADSFDDASTQRQLWGNIYQLTNLRELELSNCALRDVPQTFSSQRHPHLNFVEIAGDEFTDLPAALIEVDADVVLSSSSMDEDALLEAMSQRTSARIEEATTGGFALESIYSNAQKEIRAQLREAWEGREGLTEGEAGLRVRLPVDLGRLQDRVCEHVENYHDMLELLGHEMSATTEVAAQITALQTTLLDFTGVHFSRLDELAGEGARHQLQKDVLGDLISQITVHDLAEAALLLNSTGPNFVNTASTEPQLDRMSLLVDWSVPRAGAPAHPEPTALFSGRANSVAASVSSNAQETPADESASHCQQVLLELTNSAWCGPSASSAQVGTVDKVGEYFGRDEANAPLSLLAPGMPGLRNMTMMTHLNFRGFTPTQSPEVSQLRSLKSFCYDDLGTSTPFTQRDWQAIAPLADLQRLYLSNVTEVPGGLSQAFPQLNSITLTNCHFSELPDELMRLDANIELSGVQGMSEAAVARALEQRQAAVDSGVLRGTLSIETLDPVAHRAQLAAISSLARFEAGSMVQAAWTSLAPRDQMAPSRSAPIEITALCSCIDGHIRASLARPLDPILGTNAALVKEACVARALVLTQIDFENVLPIDQDILAGPAASIDLQRQVIANAVMTILDNEVSRAEVAQVFAQDIPGIYAILAEEGSASRDSESDLQLEEPLPVVMMGDSPEVVSRSIFFSDRTHTNSPSSVFFATQPLSPVQVPSRSIFNGTPVLQGQSDNPAVPALLAQDSLAMTDQAIDLPLDNAPLQLAGDDERSSSLSTIGASAFASDVEMLDRSDLPPPRP